MKEVASWPPAAPAVVTDFCTEAVAALDEGSCYVLPEHPTAELLFYLHGTLPPTKTSPQKVHFQSVVANAARRAGVAAIIPRGRRGLAPATQSGWWGWPTSGEAYREYAQQLVAEFRNQQSTLERLTTRRFTRIYLAGSSSGAYFAAALAGSGAWSVDAFGAMSGGAVPPRAIVGALSPHPFYIGYGSRDVVGASATALAAWLRGAGWPVRVEVHPFGHGAQEAYLDGAFQFWRSELGPPPPETPAQATEPGDS